MKYILFDLEFNSTKNNSKDKYINEIIEIGAVKLDSNFREISSFSEVIKPCISKKLNKYVKTLTHITEQELNKAPDFNKIIIKFKKWCGKKKDYIFLTWSDTDLHVLVENYNQILGKPTVDFIEKYVDLQKYILHFIKTENNNQISLSSAADYFKIDTSKFSMHRALDDSRVCSNILNKSYQENIFLDYINSVESGDFYKRLMFTPYFITDINNPLIDKNDLVLLCPKCKSTTNSLGKIKFHNNSFSTLNKCPKCQKKYFMGVRFKKTFDNVIINRRIKEYTPKKKQDNA